MPFAVRRAFLIVQLLMTGCCIAGRLQAGEDASATNRVFREQVAPLLTKHCARCHGEDTRKNDLDLRTPASLLHGGVSGPAAVAGRARESLIVQLVGPKGSPHMPPRGQLSEAEIATLSRWIDSLPTATTVERPVAGRDHWAFRPPVRPTLPAVANPDWLPTPIDAFILAQLEAKQLKPATPASPAALLRRVYLDLIGLPPTPEEVQAFMADRSPDALATVVDRLLASPHYGERWGRHWLDLARYADSGGFHSDIDRPNAWRYRDYVIRSFNDDKPYPAFIREQLAGDEVDPDNPEILAATAFGRNGPSNDDNMGMGKEREKYRLDELDDAVSTTASVFLGLTLGCARCHDHKYDPIPQTDYYRFLAVFNNTERMEVPLKDGRPDYAAAHTPLRKQAPGPGIMAFMDRDAKPRPTRLLWRGDLNNPGPEVGPAVPAVLSAQPVPFPAARVDSRSTGRRLTLANWIAAPDNPLTWRVLANRIWQHHFGRGLVATPGNFGLSGARPSHPELLDYLATELAANGGHLKPLHRQIVLSATYQQASRGDATAAQLDPDNALLARMNVRRLEAEAIRDGILAVSGKLHLQAGGPGIKPRIRPDLLPASQRNKWPVVAKEGPEHWRRSVYIYIKRQLMMPLLELFDAPATTSTCNRREESVVPTQALVLMNDDFVHDQAGFFANRVRREAGPSPEKQAEQALWLALSRPPSAGRVADAVAFLSQQAQAHRDSGLSETEAERQALTDLCHVLFNCNEFVYLD
jgi:mono/diheme cytochrome c family protein